MKIFKHSFKPIRIIVLSMLLSILSTTNYLNAQNRPITDLDVPLEHPRIFWNTEMLNTAKEWYAKTPFTPTRKSVLSIHDGPGAIELAFAYLVSEGIKTEAERKDYARRAIAWTKLALTEIESENFEISTATCNTCRWYGDGLFMVLDWCFDELTVSERIQFSNSIMEFVPLWNTANWGGVNQPRSNYFHGYTRNSIYAGLFLYHENKAFAVNVLNHALKERWGVFKDYATAGGISGIQSEGTSYNVAIQRYHLYTGISLINAGYDYFRETNYFKRTIGFNLYNVGPDRSYISPNEKIEDSYWLPFPYGDAAVFMNVNEWSETYSSGYAHFMLLSSFLRQNEGNGKLAKYARTWVDKLQFFNQNYPPAKFVESVTAHLPKADLSEIPLDYFAPYGGHTPYGYTRNSWKKDATAIHIQLGKPPLGGHEHNDAGSFTLMRGNRYLVIPTSGRGYGSGWSIPNYEGDRESRINVENSLSKNTILFGKRGSTGAGHTIDNVDRLMSHQDFFFAANDLTPAYKNLDNPTHNSNANVERFERETIFIRQLETLIIFDRTQSVKGKDQTKTSLLHTQGSPLNIGDGQYSIVNNHHEALINILLPKQRDIAIIDETKVIGCDYCRDREDEAHRTQIENTEEGLVYFLNVIQSKSANDPVRVSTNLQETENTFLLSLQHKTKGYAVIEFEKGQTSTKGKIAYHPTKIPEELLPLPEEPQVFDITNDGPVWYEIGTEPPTETPDIIDIIEEDDSSEIELDFIDTTVLHIDFNNNQAKKGKVKIYSLTGALVFNSEININAGNAYANLPYLAKNAVYILRITSDLSKKVHIFKIFIN